MVYIQAGSNISYSDVSLATYAALNIARRKVNVAAVDSYLPPSTITSID